MTKTKPILTTKLGKLYSGDCLKVMPEIPEDSIDCFFADPPFNLNKSYGKNVDDNLTSEDYLDWCKQWIDEGIRILKPGGSFFLYNLPKWNIHLAAHIAQKLTFRNWITVEIKFSLPISGRLYPSHYSLLYFVKGKKPKTFHPDRLPLQICRHCGEVTKDYGGYKDKLNPLGISLTDVWLDIPPVRHKKYKKRESNELSLKFMDRIIELATDKGDVIFDPFGGSGTTYIGAELKGRKWLGTEISTHKAITQRFKNIHEDRENHEAIRTSMNKLFTPAMLAFREKCGHTNGKYRLV